jgi:hypothetical protein
MRARAAFFIALAAGAQSCRCEKEPPAPTPRAEAAPAPAPTAPEGAAVLIGSRGAVELQRGSKAWEPATQGTRLGESDALRTPGDAEAELSVDGVRVKLHDRSEIRLSAASAGVLRGRVRGRVESDVEQGKGRVSLQVEDGPIAESTGGHFFLTAEGRNVAVAATSGAVQVASGGKTVNVRQGQVTRVESAGKVVPPTAALRRVLLAVQWPGDKTNRSSIPVLGRVASGSRVYVQGQAVEVAPSGQFHAEVVLQDGRQKIAVVTIDPFGRRKSDESVITRDQSLPQVRIGSPWAR